MKGAQKLFDPLMDKVVRLSGILVVGIVLALAFYLSSESRYAFSQPFPFGFRFAATPEQVPSDYDFEYDPNVTSLKTSAEGADGLDEKEEMLPTPAISDLAGVAQAVTFAMPEGGPEGALTRDDWRPVTTADKATNIKLGLFTTPELDGKFVKLSWKPDLSFDPASSPYRFSLVCAQSPAGVPKPEKAIDLSAEPSGSISLPAVASNSDEDRTKGYVFELQATPNTTQLGAVLGAISGRTWAPTAQYPQFGFLPLVGSTLLLTVLSVLLATVPSVALAIYLSEIAPLTVREWLKPTIEALASVPTVVLGFFGIVFIGPALHKTIGAALSMESGRAMATVAVTMAILLVPTITTFAEDALRNVPESLRDGGYAVGLTFAENLRAVILPSAKGGLIAAVLMGVARAVGETMIVYLCSGGTPNMPSLANLGKSLGMSFRGVPDGIATDVVNVDFEGPHYGFLFLLGLVLFAITTVVNLTGFRLGRAKV